MGVRFNERGDQLVDLCVSDHKIVSGLLSDGRSLRIDLSTITPDPEADRGHTLKFGSKDLLRGLVPLTT
jgi:hypothetical protein